MTNQREPDGASAPEPSLVARQAADAAVAPLAESDMDAPTTGRVDDAGAVQGRGDPTLGADAATTADPSADSADPIEGA